MRLLYFIIIILICFNNYAFAECKANVDMNNNKIINVGDPTDNYDAINKKYFDSYMKKIKVHNVKGHLAPVGLSSKYTIQFENKNYTTMHTFAKKHFDYCRNLVEADALGITRDDWFVPTVEELDYIALMNIFDKDGKSLFDDENFLFTRTFYKHSVQNPSYPIPSGASNNLTYSYKNDLFSLLDANNDSVVRDKTMRGFRGQFLIMNYSSLLWRGMEFSYTNWNDSDVEGVNIDIRCVRH